MALLDPPSDDSVPVDYIEATLPVSDEALADYVQLGRSLHIGLVAAIAATPMPGVIRRKPKRAAAWHSGYQQAIEDVLAGRILVRNGSVSVGKL